MLDEPTGKAALKACGLTVPKGEVVAIIQVNCPQYIESYFACAKAGFILSPLNFRAKAEELSYMLNFSETHHGCLQQAQQ